MTEKKMKIRKIIIRKNCYSKSIRINIDIKKRSV